MARARTEGSAPTPIRGRGEARVPRASDPAGAKLADEMVRTSEALARHPDDGWVFAEPYPMSRDLIAAFHGVIRALIPPEPVVPDVEVRIEQQVRRMMPYMQKLVAFGFMAVLRALDYAPLWRGKGLRRLRDMSPEAASALLEELEQSRIGPVSDMVVGARAAVLAPYYDLDEVAAHIGYDPTPFMRGRIALRRRLLAGEQAGQGDRIGPYSERVAALVRDADAHRGGEEGA